MVIDRLTLERKNMSRLREAIEGALKLTDGKLVSFLLTSPEAGADVSQGGAAAKEEYRLQGTQLACPKCGISIPELEPRFFSFNDPKGQCPACRGLGESCEFDINLIVPDPSLSIKQGCLAPQKKDDGCIISSEVPPA